MIHPATAHFAIVLPVMASIFGIVYLIYRNEVIGKLTSATTFFSALAMILAWYTGSQAGPEIYDYLSEAGQHELVEHKNLGLVLAIALSIAAAIKSTGCSMKKFWLEAVAIVLVIGITAATLVQGKDGGEIVYKYGMPFKAYMMEDSLNEAAATAEETGGYKEGLEAYEEAHEDIKALSQEVDALFVCKDEKEDSERNDEDDAENEDEEDPENEESE